MAFPIASSFIVHILGIFATAVAFRKAKKQFHQSRYVLAAVCILVGLASAWFTININSKDAKAAFFVPSDPPNSPMGVAKGIHPGRVAWVHDPNATDWDGSTEFYWDDDHTDQNAVDQMMSTALLWLTGEPNDDDAWDALFRHFNQTHGKGDVGYQTGEKIVIKPNNNEQRSHGDTDNNADMSPHLVLALLKQLVWHAGVSQNCITLCDPSRFIADKTYYKCDDVFPNVVYEETCYTSGGGTAGRVSVVPSDLNLIYYSACTGYGCSWENNRDRFPTSYVNAAYVINLAGLKGHINAGVTLCGKNLYGAPSDRNPVGLHDSLPYLSSGLGRYRAIVDLMGHKHMGGKTVLYLIDGLWGSRLHKDPPETWSMSPFNNDYTSSLFASQDPVAIDSVCLDFLRTEWGDQWDPAGNSIDDYLHEAALANDPPSGTFYDPHHGIYDPNKTRLESLGVHEHWNNSTDKIYSRNLGISDGIELISAYTWTCTSLPEGDVDRDCEVNFADVDLLVQHWLKTDIAESNLVSLWEFDERGGTAAHDWADDNHGTIYGAEWTTGHIGRAALSFDGLDDYVDFGDNDIEGVFASGSSAFTISVWIEPNTLSASASNHGTRNVILARASDNYNDNFELGVSPAGDLDLYIDENHDDITKTFGAGEITTNSWHHIACIFDSGSVEIYLDGNHYVGSFAGSSLDDATGSEVTVGATTHSDIYFKGVIDDVRIYNRPLDANEIMQGYGYSPRANLNEDCKIDFMDFAILADNWLECNLWSPSSGQQ